MIELRGYQQEAINCLRQSLARHRRIVLQLPTGAGKTVIASFMHQGSTAKNIRSMFLVHRRELLLQASRTFGLVGIHHGVIAPGCPGNDAPVQIAMAQTVARRIDTLPAPGFIVVDECHHATAATWRNIFARWTDAKMVGLTATPCRLDGRGLDAIFDDLVIGPSVRALIDMGHLADYRIFAPPIGIDTSKVHTRAGDFAQDELAELVDKPSITGGAVETWRRVSPGMRTIVFCVSVKHSLNVVEQYRRAGIEAVHIDGAKTAESRDRIISGFSQGEFPVLSSVDLIGEGLDVPGVQAVQILRPTKSLGLHIQQIGRAMRPKGGEFATVIDHAGNVFRHGLPDDEREWTLKGRQKKSKQQEEVVPGVRRCPGCYAVARVGGARVCASCGHVWEVQGREVQEVAGELQAIDLAAIREAKKKELALADSMRELQRIEQERGYKPGWARHVAKARALKRGGIWAAFSSFG